MTTDDFRLLHFVADVETSLRYGTLGYQHLENRYHHCMFYFIASWTTLVLWIYLNIFLIWRAIGNEVEIWLMQTINILHVCKKKSNYTIFFVPLIVRIFFPCCHTVYIDHLKIAASVTIIFTCKKYEFYYNKRRVSGSVREKKRERYWSYPEYWIRHIRKQTRLETPVWNLKGKKHLLHRH